MRPPPRLRLEPRPSRLLRRWLCGGALATAMLAAGLPLPWLLRLALVLVVALVTLRAARRTLGRGLPALVHVGADRRLAVTGRDGCTRLGGLLPASRAGFRVTTRAWRPDARPGRLPRVAETLLVLPDMLPPEDFRQLRVLLRYGRGGRSAAATSAVSAGRPASQALPS